MIEYFAKDYTGDPFQLFGTGHLIALGIILLINLSFIYVRRQSQAFKDRVRYAILAALVISEGSWHIWNLAIGEWTIQTHLPFHLCAVFVWLSVIMLLTKNARIYEFAYFLGIGGALQAVLTPEAGIYGLPHFRALQTLSAHGSIVTAAVFMTVVEGYRPTWSSIKRVFIWANIYLLVVTGINLLIGSNYLYTLRKPDSASLLDLFGPWPVYLLVAEVFALILCLLLYLPFALKDRRAVAIA
ncbi:MAG: TIGR02206 family membrane protein [Anaerolineales bacterium]|nr:TIGR02206 family membrane protein [Anaerolineales bacterium]